MRFSITGRYTRHSSSIRTFVFAVSGNERRLSKNYAAAHKEWFCGLKAGSVNIKLTCVGLMKRKNHMLTHVVPLRLEVLGQGQTRSS
jgi:hypothetical protein